MRDVCDLCPHSCSIAEGKRGICQVRANIGGKIVSSAYGLLTGLALDPIEKKPLAKFYPGSFILSAGSYGCNMRCTFCQNWHISASDGTDIHLLPCTPEELVTQAVNRRKNGNIGLAYTYNEPLVNYEYVHECAKLARAKGLKNVLVTNGMINNAHFVKLLEYIDAANIDLKSFSPEFYRLMGGDLEIVKGNIQTAAEMLHLEVTTLVIEGLNDSKDEIDAECKWLSGINNEIPLHLSRFFPQYKMKTRTPTSKDKIYELKAIADKYLKYVFTGNM
ncbi:MAG: AmmeMemoRadiSam system radical SAM enzyme [Deferribacteraceae bacterium]|jgi:pyruvate formate lyase activating enzyme|nr:AmmeMemoRadiSam system radical SAM enzyme [Deferribacteraceae bacterium]